MPFPSGGLNQHRIELSVNQDRFTQDKTRTIKNWIKHARKWVSEKNPSANKKNTSIILEQMANMLWEAQGGKPLFQFDSANGLPLSWNRPQDGTVNYIRYEIGHMNPVNNGGLSNPENLCYQSARCNQHIQSSLSLDEVLESYFQDNQEVLDRVNSVLSLHQSEEWKRLRSLL